MSSARRDDTALDSYATELSAAGRDRPSTSGRVTVVVPTYHDLHLLARTLPPLARSPEVEIFIVNNDPDQDARGWAEQNLPGARVIEMGFDAGYARAMNAAIAISQGEFVLCLDSDVFVTSEYVAEALRFLRRHPRAGAVGGKLLRYDLAADRPLEFLDTAGVQLGRSRRVITRGEGERDLGQYDRAEQVFGVDGAGMVARRSALESIAFDGEYFDSSFFMHKEDTDLCWRLRLAGWEVWYLPSAVGAHGRTTRGIGTRSYLTSIVAIHRNERAKRPIVRYHAMKNQWLLLSKNEDAVNFARDLVFIAARETTVVLYNCLFAPKTLTAVRDYARLLPGAIRKRRLIKRRQTVRPAEMRPWLRA